MWCRWTNAWRREGDPDRNLTHLRESLLDHTPMRPEQIHAMPVESPDLETAAQTICLDLSAKSLVRRRRSTWSTWALGRTDILPLWCLEIQCWPSLTRMSALTGVYQGRRRMTLTYPVINRARRILWLVTGREKAGMLDRLYKGDLTIPSGRICRERAVIVADRAAAGNLTCRVW